MILSAPPRSASLVHVNAMLREQLGHASSANRALSDDIRKVTSDWTRSCKEMEQREAAWRREEEVSPEMLDTSGPCWFSLVFGNGALGKGSRERGGGRAALP